jgi:Pvc16 N-terminal domain
LLIPFIHYFFMANVWAIHSVGDSLVTYLRDAYQRFVQEQEALLPAGVPELDPFPGFEFRLVSSNNLDDMDNESDNVLSLYLHRITINEHLRNARPTTGLTQPPVPLSIDLHYLITTWADSARSEQLMMAWVMRQLHSHSLLDSSYLSTMGGWSAQESVQMIPAELSNEDMMRIWDALKPSYHLSFAYIARVVQIEPDAVEASRPVVATRFSWGEPVEVLAGARE